MQKDFDKWNTEKKIINNKGLNPELFFHIREIWWCSSGLNIGVESDGKHDNFERPALIIRKFNPEMLWILPLTTKGKENKYYFKLKHDLLNSWVVLSQIKTISTKRLLRKVDSISEDDFKEVIFRLTDILMNNAS